MASRPPLVLGSDGLLQQLQSTDSLSAGGTAPASTSANAALGNGYILKAGQVTSTTAGVGTVTFPTAFPTACIAVTATAYVTSTNALTMYSVVTTSVSKTGCTFQVNALVLTALLAITSISGVSVSIQWTAIGY